MLQFAGQSQITNPELARHFSRLGERIVDLSQLRNYGSLPEKISEYAVDLSKDLELNPSRSRYLDQAIRREQLHEADLNPLTATTENLETSSFILFEGLLDHLNQLIELRYDMLPTKGKRPSGTSKELLNSKRPEFDIAISGLAKTIGVFFEGLSSQSRDFVEKYIKEHHGLIQRFMNSNLPKSKIKFRPLFGLDKNQDGSKRIRIKASQKAKAHKAKTQNSRYKAIATHDEGKFYRLKMPAVAQPIYAEKISRTYNDGSARFRPTDADLRANMMKMSGGKDFTVAYIS